MKSFAWLGDSQDVVMQVEGTSSWHGSYPSRVVRFRMMKNSAAEVYATLQLSSAYDVNAAGNITVGGANNWAVICSEKTTSTIPFSPGTWYDITVDLTNTTTPTVWVNSAPLLFCKDTVGCIPEESTTLTGMTVYSGSGVVLVDSLLLCKSGRCEKNSAAHCGGSAGVCRDYICRNGVLDHKLLSCSFNATDTTFEGEFLERCVQGYRGTDCATKIDCYEVKRTMDFPNLLCHKRNESYVNEYTPPAVCNACVEGTLGRSCFFRRSAL